MAQRIAQELHARGHRVSIVSTMPPTDPATRRPLLREASIERVYRFAPHNLYYLLDDHRFPYPLRAVWHLVDLCSASSERCVEEVLRQEKPDIVLTHNLKGIGLRVPQAARTLGIPWIHTVHDVQLSVPSGLLLHGHRDHLVSIAFRNLYGMAVRKAMGPPNAVISPSQFLADFYRQQNFFRNVPVHILPNPAPSWDARSRRPVRFPGPLRLLMAGQLERHKGVNELIDAVRRLSIPFELHMAGEGTLVDFVRDLGREDRRIVYHGFVSMEGLRRLFAIMDATVVPSVCAENSPTVIYESFQAGVPVIASKIGGVGELIREGKNGLLVELGDVAVWTAAIESFDGQKDMFWARGPEITASVESYSLPHYVDTLEEIIRGVLGRT